MSDYIVLPPPQGAQGGKCLNCDDPAWLVYTLRDGQRLKVCSEGCIISLLQPDDRDIAGVITPAEIEERQARRRKGEIERREEPQT